MIRLVKCFSLWKNGLRSSFFLFMLVGLTGCRSVRKMEMVTVTDTVRVVLTDTVVRENVTVVRDTIRIKVTDSVVVKVDAEGNVSRERYYEENRLQTTDNRQRTTEERKRTTDYGQRRTEDRQRTTDNRQQTTETWKDRLLDRIGVIGLAVLILVVGFLVRKFIK